MANGNIQVPPDSTGKKVDAASLDVGADSVIRQRIVIGDNSATAQFATVTNGALTVTGNLNISATASVVVGAGTANIGTINDISRTVQVAIGTPFTLNNISATVTVAGSVTIAAGTANMGTINDISKTVNVAFAGGISLAAGTANIGFINNISATVNVAFAGGISLAAGTANIGFINNISATVTTGMAYVHDSTQTSNHVYVGDSANSALRVNVVAGSASGPSNQDGSLYSTGVHEVIPGGYIFFSASATTVGDGRVAAARMTEYRGVHSNLRTDGGVKMEDSANAALRVNVVAGSASGPSIVDNTTYSTGVTNTAPAGFMFFSASSTAMTDGRMGAARMTEFRGLHVNLRANAGTEIGTAAAPLYVNVEGISKTASVVLAAGAANIGTVNNISAAVVLAAGANNIGSINNISATVTVLLAAGTANFGTLNNISATVSVVNAAGTALMGAVSLAAGTANIGFINNISATVNTVIGAGTALIGAVSIAAGTALMGAVSLAAGTANIGFINNISATVTVATTNAYVINIQSASHGPKMLQISTSATATLIAAPGAGNFVYVTSLAVTNGGTVTTGAHIGWSGSPDVVVMYLVSAGGGFVMNFDPPWKVLSNEAVQCRVKPNSSGNVYFNVNFFVNNL
jgi:hypothetical protein